MVAWTELPSSITGPRKVQAFKIEHINIYIYIYKANKFKVLPFAISVSPEQELKLASPVDVSLFPGTIVGYLEDHGTQ